jgi:hypothetical protein
VLDQAKSSCYVGQLFYFFTRGGETMLVKFFQTKLVQNFGISNRRMPRWWTDFQFILIGIKKCGRGGDLLRALVKAGLVYL